MKKYLSKKGKYYEATGGARSEMNENAALITEVECSTRIVETDGLLLQKRGISDFTCVSNSNWHIAQGFSH